MYGSKRLGSIETGAELQEESSRSAKQFELTNHLGNVVSVITNKKKPVNLDSDANIDYFSPVLISSTTYWPFGYPLETDNGIHNYRFGFQGQEHDDEWTGQTGSHLAFKYRVHDARIGRFLSIDPLTAKYPHNSPYAFSENRVIDGVELEGLEYLPFGSVIKFQNGAIVWDYRNVSGFTRNQLYAQDAAIISQHVTFEYNMNIYATCTPNSPEAYSNTSGNITIEKSISSGKYTLFNKSYPTPEGYKVNAKAPSKFWMIDVAVYTLKGIDFLCRLADKKRFISEVPKYQLTHKLFHAAYELGYIPQELIQDETNVSNIMNVILTGELSNLNSEGLYQYTNREGELRYYTASEYNNVITSLGLSIYENRFAIYQGIAVENPFEFREGHTREEIQGIIENEDKLFKFIEYDSLKRY